MDWPGTPRELCRRVVLFGGGAGSGMGSLGPRWTTSALSLAGGTRWCMTRSQDESLYSAGKAREREQRPRRHLGMERPGLDPCCQWRSRCSTFPRRGLRRCARSDHLVRWTLRAAVTSRRVPEHHRPERRILPRSLEPPDSDRSRRCEGAVEQPAALDLFTWLSYRCFTARGRERVPLFGEFGLVNQGSTEYARPRKLEGWLKLIRAMWPECPAYIDADGNGMVDHRSNAVLQSENPNRNDWPVKGRG
jgi:hypothetical protein